MTLKIEKGWKKEENDRHGDCLVVRFYNSKDDKLLFRWAPNLRDEPFMVEMWSKLKVYDELHKATLRIEDEINKIEGTKGLMKEC